MTPLQRRRWSPAIRQRAQALYNSTEPPMPAAQIAKELETDKVLEQQLTAAGHMKGTPSDRTIQDWIRRGVIERSDNDRPWIWTDGSPEDARLVLETMRYLADRNDGSFAYVVTRQTATWIPRLRRVIPDAPLEWIYLLANDTAEGGDDAERAALVIRQQPWRDGGARLRTLISEGELEPIYESYLTTTKVLVNEW